MKSFPIFASICCENIYNSWRHLTLAFPAFAE